MWLKNNLLNEKCQYKCKEVKEFDEEIEKIEKECQQVIKEVTNTPEKYFAGIAIVSFSVEIMKQVFIQGNKISKLKRFLNYFKQGKSNKNENEESIESILYWNDNCLYVEQAPEPNDIDWEFIHHNTGERLKARLISNIL